MNVQCYLFLFTTKHLILFSGFIHSQALTHIVQTENNLPYSNKHQQQSVHVCFYNTDYTRNIPNTKQINGPMRQQKSPKFNNVLF